MLKTKKLISLITILLSISISCTKQGKEDLGSQGNVPVIIPKTALDVDYSKITESYIKTGKDSTNETKMVNYLEKTYGEEYSDVYKKICSDSRFKNSQARLNNSNGVTTENDLFLSVNELGLSQYGSSRLLEFHTLLDNDTKRLDSLLNINKKEESITEAKKIISVYRQSIINDNKLIESEKNGILIAIKASEDNLNEIVNIYYTPINKNSRTTGLLSAWRKVKTVTINVATGTYVGLLIAGVAAGPAAIPVGAAVGGSIGLGVGIYQVSNNTCYSRLCNSKIMDCNTGNCK